MLVLLILSALWDVCLYSVPNKLLIIASVILFGLSPDIRFIVYAMLTVLVFMPLYKLGAFGGGDVKLFAIMCATLGTASFLRCFVCIILFGGIFSLLKLLSQGKIIQRFVDVKNYALMSVRTKSVSSYEPEEKLVIPFTLAMLSGYVAFLNIF